LHGVSWSLDPENHLEPVEASPWRRARGYPKKLDIDALKRAYADDWHGAAPPQTGA